MIRLCLTLAASLACSGCETLTTSLETSVVCSLDARTAMVNSQWGLFGISTKLRKGDVPYICHPTAAPISSAPALRIVPDVVLP